MKTITSGCQKLCLSNTVFCYSMHSSQISEVRRIMHKKLMTVFIVNRISKISKELLEAECCNIHTESDIHN